MRFGDLTYLKIRQAAEANYLVVVPTGCTEQQGPHLPVDFDTWLAESVCLAASERVRTAHGIESLVLPPIPFGPTPEHRGFGAGFIDLPRSIHEAIVQAVLDSLADQGFAKIVLWKGCGQHDLTGVVKRFNDKFSARARVHLPDSSYGQIWKRALDGDVEGGHADGFTTSLALYLRPGDVQTDLIPAPQVAEVDWDDPELDLSAHSSSGVIGDPTVASREMGEHLWEAVVDEVAAILREISVSGGGSRLEDGA